MERSFHLSVGYGGRFYLQGVLWDGIGNDSDDFEGTLNCTRLGKEKDDQLDEVEKVNTDRRF